MYNQESSPLNSSFEEKVREVLACFHVPGVAVAVVDRENTYAQGYGFAQLPSTPVTAQTLFFTGSTTKAFTAATLSTFVSDDEDSESDATAPGFASIRWTTPIHEILADDFCLEDDYSTLHVTLADALSHRTGLPRHDFAGGVPGRDLRDTVRSLRHLPLTATLRSKFQYTNLMYATIGYVIEKLAGKTLEAAIRERIWEPLGMTDTGFKLRDVLQVEDKACRMSKGYRWDEESESWAVVEYLDFVALEGAGATISTVLDYAPWLRTMIYARPPLSRAAHAAMTSSQSIVSDTSSSSSSSSQDAAVQPNPFIGVETYGFGWSRRVYRNHLIIHHAGGLTGYASMVLYIPEKEWGVIIMGNTSGAGHLALTILAFHLIDNVLDVPEGDRVDWAQIGSGSTIGLSSAPAEQVPSIPTPVIAPRLAPEEYAGTYTHPGYGSFRFTYEKADLSPVQTNSGTSQNLAPRQFSHCLKAVIKRTREISITLTHVSGESWLLRLELGEGVEKVGLGNARFLVGSDGNLELGLEMKDELRMAKNGDMIYLKKETV
ncbi:beta-lactamase/transpeptidase-like protein [Xylariales sp. PMI_506]|nr:beta-lactamase/transpeptidase-like protein [Xylariales sp. PMI_506]